MITTTYIVHKNTCALLPAKQIEYGTTIIEQAETKREQATPFDSIKESCLAYWSDYDGWRLNKRPPIPVSITHVLCFFPTHSPTHINKCWINYPQINRWAEIPRRHRKENEQIEVIFKNGVRIALDVSAHTFQTQRDRAFLVMYESGMVSREK